MIAWLKTMLRRLGGQSPAPPPAGRRPSQSAVPGTGGPRVEYRDAPPPRPPHQVHWKREHLRVPRMGIDSWAWRASPRQKVLVLGAAISLIALTVSAVNRLTVSRTLPATVHGYWTTDAARYGGLAMELRAHVVAFKTTDSANAVVIHRIVEVTSRESAHGSSFRASYDAEGAPVELRFTFEDGTTPQIIFEHQPLITWRRFSVNGTMLPRSY